MLCVKLVMKKAKIRLQFVGDDPYIRIMKNILISMVLALILLGGLFGRAALAVEMEFNVGFTYDHPLDKPVPAFTDGYGYNFGTCLWFKEKYGIGFGAINTKHSLNGGTVGNQEFQVDAERDFLYIEGRYKFYRTNYWEFSGILGYTFINNLKGGDSSGSYLQFRDSSTYDTEQIGYTGSGGWVGLAVYRAIKSANKGYFAFATLRYNFQGPILSPR